jgi:hypothetical protein
MKMKSIRIALLIFAAFVATTALAQSNAQSAFDKLKQLQGDWAGKSSEGRDLQVSFRVVSGGSAIMSEIHGDGPEDMITMFHLDGDRLMMTHYCGTGNQPRMVGSMSPDGKTLTFDFLDATNVLSSQPGHMQRLILSMPNSNHQIEAWDFLGQNGKMEHHTTFDLMRTK